MADLPTGWGTYTDPSGMGWPTPPVADPMTGAPSAPAPSPFVPVAPIDPSLNPNVQPAGPMEVRGNSYAPANSVPGIPDITKGGADAAGAGTPAQAPDILGAADRAIQAQPAFVSQTATDTTDSSTGVDKAGAANIRQAGDQANAASAASGAAQVQGLKDTGALEQHQAQAAYGRGVNDYFQNAAALHLQDEIVTETAARLEDTAKFKPDRTALFKGDNGTMFGISAAISAMAGGWLMGQGLTGGKNPYLDSVMRMIDDNAQDQIEANSHVYQVLTQKLGSAQAAQKELKARMLGAVNDTIEAQSRFEKGELVQKGAAGVMAQVQAEQAKNRLEVEKTVARQTTHTVQKKTQLVANPAAFGGVDVRDPKEYARVGKVQALTTFAADAASLARTGELGDSVGLFDENWDSVANALHARSPSAAKVEALKSKWETAMRSSWESEPNGQEVQRRLSLLAFPRQDSEIPIFLQNVNEAVNAADPGGRYRIAARAMGNTPKMTQNGRTPVVK